MDLLEFSDCKLYFEEPLPAEAEELIESAARDYGTLEGERALLYAHLMAPEHLTVLVGLYRYYFYQHRLGEALLVVERSMQLAAGRLQLPLDWHALDEQALAVAAGLSFGLLRFYLLAMKAACVVLLRLGRIDDARERLAKLAILDIRDQLGAAKLLEVLDEFRSTEAEAALAA